jgi:hypothetical protein
VQPDGTGGASVTKARIGRGRPAYGADVGIVLLDADLPRPVGDVGNAATFAFALHYEVTEGAPVDQVVERAAAGLLGSFVQSGRKLLRRGATAIATSCGFLSIFQADLVESLRVPCATSSLLQIPLLLRVLPLGQKIGLVTANASTLGERHFLGAGVTADDMARVVPIGLERTRHFYSVIVGGDGPLDVAEAEAEVVAACTEALDRDHGIAAFLLECTNLPPYARAIREATGRPVWDAVSLIEWLRYGVQGLGSL